MAPVPTTATEAAEWQKERRLRRGWSTTKLASIARAIAQREGSTFKLTQQSVSGFEQPGAVQKIPEWFRFVVRAFEEGEQPEAPPRPSDLPVARDVSSGETVTLLQLDLSYSMGPGRSIDDYIESEPVEFDRAMLRSITRAEPARLRLARGVGDSMFPTLQTADRVMIDTTQTVLNQTDRIWAVSINGAGAIKRLRAIGGGKVLILSDNKEVPPQEVDADDLVIGGRVIWLARDI